MDTAHILKKIPYMTQRVTRLVPHLGAIRVYVHFIDLVLMQRSLKMRYILQKTAALERT